MGKKEEEEMGTGTPVDGKKSSSVCVSLTCISNVECTKVEGTHDANCMYLFI